MWVHEHTPALQGPSMELWGEGLRRGDPLLGIHTPQPGHVPGSPGHRQHLGKIKHSPLLLLLSLPPAHGGTWLLQMDFGEKRKSGHGQASHPTSFSTSCFSFTPKHICDKDITVMMHRASSLTDISKALPTASYSSLGALVVLGTEE